MTPEKNHKLYESVRQVLNNAYQTVYRAVNTNMVTTYWEIGRLIIEEEQNGTIRAEYGKQVLKDLSKKLTAEFGKGFSIANLRNFRQFYLVFPDICRLNEDSQSKLPIRYTLSSELSWSHFCLLIRVESKDAREFYIKEASTQNWSVRALSRQINTLYYERIISSQDKLPVKKEAEENTDPLIESARDFIKDPYILEFLKLNPNNSYLEKTLENSLIENLHSFILELGKGFAFVSRQYHLNVENDHYYIDLVFYNYILKCFVLVDLKVGKLTHQDVGQMDMYVRLFEEKIKQPDDNPTIGIILCSQQNKSVIKYSVLSDSKQLFSSKYKLYLPTEEELKKEIERDRIHIENELREQMVKYQTKN
ncbi:PDDEXK nuclease domain-containing protein [Sunxiuqinia indica]|uniref:PDDEXK nuclease domain-containing protein n=1 Tax=Sunxiuqinia indica TaxID=2692584 RepID=UPI0013579D6E|nr:PDDEXK nuclease domain-containing protein [Sunxiuqinia indica]